MNDKPIYIASCSFGKDSIATVLLALENNEPLDRVVFVEVMFDHERGISGEDPTHIEWVHSVAIPKLRTMGVEVDVVRSVADFVGKFYTVISQKSKKPERWGKYRAWLVQGGCALNRDGKLKAIRNYYSQFKQPVVQYVGIAIDEPVRLARLGSNKISLLAKYGYTEADAWRKCEEYGLLSPFYELGYKRNGCWFCPNKPMKYYCHIRKNYPTLWEELQRLDRVPNKVSDYFNKRYTFEQLEARMDFEDKKIAFKEKFIQQTLF